MNVKIFLAALLLIFVLGTSSIVFAQANPNQSLINQLEQQLIQLQNQLVQLLNQQQTSGSGSWCYTFNNDLVPDNSGISDVAYLHIALQKEGFSYDPDTINTYSTGTIQAVKQFQIKYGVASQTGLVGPLTRAKLNKIYACNATNCTPSWQASAWSTCINNKQTRTVTDANNCGLNINKPVANQSCCNASCLTQSDGVYAIGCTGTLTKCTSGYTCQQTFSTSYTYNNNSVQNVQTLTGSQCVAPVTTSCAPLWQTGAWSTCINGQQTRTVNDANNCGIVTSRPATNQSCTVKLIDIQVNGSDGPVNSFVTLGNGATATSSGVTLSENINLQWTGINVSSCVASDSQNPQVFSGYVPPSGSQSVTLTGNIQNVSSSSKVSDTFKISCTSTITGLQVNDTLTANLYYTASANCTPNWQCTSWGSCSNGNQARVCIDNNGCGSLTGKPAQTQSCTCTPSWQTGDWSTCVSSRQTRTVTDSNNCGLTTNKPVTSQYCCAATCLTQTDGVYAISCSGTATKCASGRTCQQTYSTSYTYNNNSVQTVQTLNGSQCVCIPSWQTGDWGNCVNDQQTRTVTDSNNCGLTTNKPATSQYCQ